MNDRVSYTPRFPTLAALGFRAIAPDMRGYGRSFVYPHHGDYAQEHIVRDMIEVVDSLGREKAVWVGHDWGSPVMWSLASHHPDRCHAVANLCVNGATMRPRTGPAVHRASARDVDDDASARELTASDSVSRSLEPTSTFMLELGEDHAIAD